MPKLIFLGTANAIPSQEHENTHMALVGEQHKVLIDCVGSPLVRLPQAGLPALELTDLILTHFHPDHISGVPSLLMGSWLLGRTQPLEVYGLAYTLDRIEAMMGLYEWHTWPGFFPVHFHRLPEEEMTPVLRNEEMAIYASPVRHLVPTIGLRVEFPKTEHAMAYSCDTEPCQEVVRLASGVDYLIHEATGAEKGHSSAEQAGAIARQAEVGNLVLIHYTTKDSAAQSLIPQASEAYTGPIALAQDFMKIRL
jgi:ribonuclease Z